MNFDTYIEILLFLFITKLHENFVIHSVIHGFVHEVTKCASPENKNYSKS